MSWVMLVAMAAALAQQPWPAHVRVTPPAATVVATVNGTPLMRDRLDAAVRALLPYESYHRNLGAEKLDEVRKKALDQIVDDELEYQDAVARGLRVPDADVEKALAEAAAGYPTRRAFIDALAREGATLADMRREIRRALMIRAAFERRVTAQCTASVSDARRYFAQHPERFVEPERLRIQAITIGVDPSGGQKAWTAGRAIADDVRRQLAAGAPFEALARRHSTDASARTGGDMGFLHRGSLTPAFEAAAAGLATGEPSAVIETIYGYHIIRVVEVQPARPRSFEDVADRLQRDLTAERCAAARDAWVSSLRAPATITYAR